MRKAKFYVKFPDYSSEDGRSARPVKSEPRPTKAKAPKLPRPTAPYHPRHAYVKPEHKWNLWDYLTADDATSLNFCRWVGANETRFTYGLLTFGTTSVAVVLSLFYLLRMLGFPVREYVSGYLPILMLIAGVAAVLLLLPLVLAYVLFYEQSRPDPESKPAA